MSRRDSEDFSEELRDSVRLLKGMHRRVAIRRTSSTKWQVLGQRGGQGGDELVEHEPFTGIGFYSRPPSSGKPEAITAAVGGTKTTVIVATRDEKTRQAAAGALAEGETAVYNDKALIVVKADGTVEIRLVGGVAIPLATKDDLDVLRTALTNAVVALGAGGVASVVVAMDAALAVRVPPTGPWPNGTKTLKGQ